MSYSAMLKRELFSNEITDRKDIMAELFGIFKSKKVIENTGIYFTTENVSLAKRVYSNLKIVADFDIQLKYLTSKKLGTHKIYEVVLVVSKQTEEKYKKFLEELNLYEKKAKKMTTREKSSVIRGFFMNCGYIKSPEKGYALDFFIDTKEEALFLYELFKKLSKKVFQTEKKSKYIVYLRNSEDILDIIYLMGGVNSFFEFEEITINKEIRNKINRNMNWEIANETKKISTSEKQIKMINIIDEKLGIDTLSNVLKEVAILRLENEELSLQELAELVGVSKSGIRNRFRRLEEIYNNLIKDSD